MKNILQEIVNYKKIEIEKSKKMISVEILNKKIKSLSKPLKFLDELRNKNEVGKAGIIAEVKKASPSKGIIKKDFNHIEIAKEYEKGGAACLSILTDTPSFQGSPQYLKDIRRNTKLPILRKDFIIDTYQIIESRSWGADCILLIMKILKNKELSKLINICNEMNMDILFEINSQEELERLLPFNPKMIGINNRNLENFETDIENSIKIKKNIPDDILVISESGINDVKDISYLGKHNINNFLIGERLMRSKNISGELSKLVNKE
ncbi:MAG: indole-3-glycerol phosphate synthase TrpC [Alphaproteobacteria bacterium]|nr:indole-3-glycerol-phosphate synthase [Rhodobiaceae bacterium]PDH51405.1 MAG: indole-3-glycerol-phosphate synthase [alpha proteobacterium MED-G09]|tara:strand:+ start:2672 stop:3466 length:795 start_codon:yes stop_codon:yes gene_type:complete